MAICQFIGVMLIVVGLIYTLLRRGQNQDSETNIEIKDFKLKGGPGSVLIVLGVLLVVFESLLLPSYPDDKQKTESQLSVTPSTGTPLAKIDNVWIEHNALKGSPGMRVHVNFNTYNLKDEECQLAAYFYSASGERLEDFNQEYRATDSNVASFENFFPMYSSTTFSDYPLFLPYSELHLAPGYYQLKLKVAVWHGGTKLAESDWVYFDCSQS